MVATTPIAGLRYAQQTDTANAETGFHNLASDVDDKIIPRFATVAARTAAIPSPINGQAAYITDTAAGGRALTMYDGAAWVPYFRAPLFAFKSADESVTSNVTHQNDDHLVLAVAANTTYVFEMWGLVTGSTAGDFSGQFTYPAGAAMTYAVVGPGPAATTNNDAETTQFNAETEDTTSPSDSTSVGTVGTSIPIGFVFKGVLVVGATAGNLQFQWAQAVSSVAATTLKKNSYLMLTRVA